MTIDLEVLASFVPRHVVRRLAAQPEPRNQPFAEVLAGAVLIADVSGFSKLTEELAVRGPTGAEDLVRILNAYFDPMIEAVLGHGGDIVSFAGDAMLAVWPAEAASGLPSQAERAATVLAAAQCGLTLQQCNQWFEREGVRLTMRVGIGAGDFRLVNVGGTDDKWQCVVTGAPMAQMAVASKVAEPGQVVVSAEAWNLLAASAEGVPAEAGTWRLDVLQRKAPVAPYRMPPPPERIAAGLRGYVPRAVLDRLDAQQAGWLAELRRVTVVFVNFMEARIESDEAIARLQHAVVTVQRIVQQHEGVVASVLVDDKGTHLIAAFGLPPLSHEDDAVRGMVAAHAVVDHLGKLGLDGAIGVATGQLFCGGQGNALRRHYTILGRAINLSARLMQAADSLVEGSAILCDDATRRAVQRRFDFEALPPLPLKGLAEPVAAFQPRPRVKALSTGRIRQERLVGRKKEQAQIIQRMDALRQGNGSVVVIEGDAGLGKTALARALRTEAERRDLRIVRGWGDAIERTTPYRAWRPTFLDVFEWEPAQKAPQEALLQVSAVAVGEGELRRPQVEARLRRLLGRENPLVALAPLLSAVLPIDLPDNDATRLLQGEGRAHRTHELLVALLRAFLGKQPFVLQFDDVHWLDSASWALLRVASLDLQPAMVALSLRPMGDEATKELRQFLADPSTVHLRLEGLPPDDAVALACARLHVQSLPEPVAGLLTDRAQGNPFYVEELAYALRDAGLVQIQGDSCRVAHGVDLDTVTFPETVQGVVASRIDRLPPQHQLLLKVASVIGRVFGLLAVRDIHPIAQDRPHLRDYLEKLRELDITPLETPPPDPSYLFRHIVTREVAYNLMLHAQRQELHRAAAAMYEERYAGALAPHYPLLAHHWQQGGDPARALGYLLRSGEQALGTGAYHEAIGFFRGALALEPAVTPRAGLVERARWRFQLGEACYSVGRVAEGRELLRAAAAELGAPYPTSPGAQAGRVLLEIGRQAWHRLVGASRGQDAGTLARRLLLSQIYERLAIIAFLDNDSAAFGLCVLRYLNLAEQAGATEQRARGYGTLVLPFAMAGLKGLARAYERLAEGMVARTRDLEARSWVGLMLGAADFDAGRWSSAQERLNGALGHAREAGNVRRWEEVAGYLMGIHYFRSDWQRTVTEAEAFGRVATRQDDAQMRAWALIYQARVALRRGDPAGALAWAQQAAFVDDLKLVSERLTRLGVVLAAHTRLRALASPAPQGQVPGPMGEAVGQPTDEAAARQVLEQLVQAHSTLAMVWLAVIDGFIAVAEFHLQRWEAGQQADAPLARAACQRFRKFSRAFDAAKPSARIAEGWCALLDGQGAKGRALLQEGIALAGRMEMAYEEATGQLHLGRLLPVDDPERAGLLAAAEATFGRLGAVLDLAAVRRVLGRPAVVDTAQAGPDLRVAS